MEGRLLEGENELAYWCMSAITLLPTLCCFFLTLFFFFLSFLLIFLSFYLFSCGVVHSCFSLLLFRSASCFLHMADGPFILLVVKGFYYFTPYLLLFRCEYPSRPPTGLLATQPPPLTYAGRATSHYQKKKSYFVCLLIVVFLFR